MVVYFTSIFLAIYIVILFSLLGLPCYIYTLLPRLLLSVPINNERCKIYHYAFYITLFFFFQEPLTQLYPRLESKNRKKNAFKIIRGVFVYRVTALSIQIQFPLMAHSRRILVWMCMRERECNFPAWLSPLDAWSSLLRIEIAPYRKMRVTFLGEKIMLNIYIFFFFYARRHFLARNFGVHKFVMYTQIRP